MTPDPTPTASHAAADPNATIDGPAAPADPTALPTVPGYDVTGVLGRGAMGVVYAARHLALNRPVALKMVLAGAHADAADLVRFRHEAELLARVTHPNVVGIYEVGAHAGLPYFALEFCPGGTLHAKLAGTPQPPRAAATLAATLARAVQAAHAAGVIHRDLKPGNVLLAADGTPKLADFGLGRLSALTRHLTQTGAGAMGTPAYMPPEQAAGDAVGPLADVYALGALLYCFLTGRPPHQGASAAETLALVRSSDPAAPRSLVPGLPRDVETVALTALHKEPGRRYATAAAFADDLERWLAGEPILARPAGRVERAAKWARRRPAVATLVASGTVGLVAFVAFLAAFTMRLNRAAAAIRMKESELFLLATQSCWDRDNPLFARANLQAVAAADRHWEWRYLERSYYPGAPVVSTKNDEFRGRQSRSLRPLVDKGIFIPAKDSVFGYKVAGFGRANSNLQSVVWSPNRTHVATLAYDNVVRIWDMKTGSETATCNGHTGWVSNAAWSPDGTRVATASADQSVRVWDAVTGREVATLRGHTAAVRSVVWSPDGARVATVGNDATIRVWSTDDRDEAIIVRGHGSNARVDWLSDGRRLRVRADHKVKTWDLATGIPALARPWLAWETHSRRPPVCNWRSLENKSRPGPIVIRESVTSRDFTSSGHTARVYAAA